MKQFISDLVSVITPVYNAEKYIEETIKSVLTQNYDNFEYILVNDYSQDNSAKIINNFTDPRLFLINNTNNIGVALSRNRAIERAKGRFIAFIDSDDIWLNNKLEKQIHTLLTSNFVMSYSALDIINDNSVHIKYQDVPDKMNFRSLLRNTAISTSSVVIDREKLSIPLEMPDRKTGEDYATWLSILKNCGDAKGECEYLTKYRISKNSLSKNRLDSFGDLWYGQHIENGISVPKFLLNYIIFALHAVKKHYF